MAEDGAEVNCLRLVQHAAMQINVRLHLAACVYTGTYTSTSTYASPCAGRFRGLRAVLSVLANAGRYPAAGYLAAIQLIDPSVLDGPELRHMLAQLAEQGSLCLGWMAG